MLPEKNIMNMMGFRKEQSMGIITSVDRASAISLIASKHGVTVVRDTEYRIKPGNVSLTLRYSGRGCGQAFWDEVDGMSPLRPPE